MSRRTFLFFRPRAASRDGRSRPPIPASKGANAVPIYPQKAMKTRLFTFPGRPRSFPEPILVPGPCCLEDVRQVRVGRFPSEDFGGLPVVRHQLGGIARAAGSHLDGNLQAGG